MSEQPRPSSQDWSAERYARNARFVAELGEPVVDWLDPRVSERVLDIGCGDGALTASIVARGADVVGIDSSSSLVRAAIARGIDARVIDVYSLSFHEEFDAAFSNAALHWMSEPDLALSNVARALRPGGRFVGEMGAHGNVAAISTAILAVLGARGIDGAARWPWYFPTPAEYAERLETHGFVVQRMELIPASDAAADWNARVARHVRKPIPDRRRGEGAQRDSRGGDVAPGADAARPLGRVDGRLRAPALRGAARALTGRGVTACTRHGALITSALLRE